MRELLAKLRQIEKELEVEKGELKLLGLFEREEGIGDWDVVFSASWVDQDEAAALRLVAGKVQATLAPRELLGISMVVPLKTTHPLVQTVLEMLHEKPDTRELGPFSVGDLEFVRGYILVPQPTGSPVPRVAVSTAAST